jgi:hypothetical protein
MRSQNLNGGLVKLSLKSHAPSLARVHFDVSRSDNLRPTVQAHVALADELPSTRALKLRLVEDVVVAGEEKHGGRRGAPAGPSSYSRGSGCVNNRERAAGLSARRRPRRVAVSAA